MTRAVAVALGGALIIGLVSSVMDVPRVAYLIWLLAFFRLRLNEATKPYH